MISKEILLANNYRFYPPSPHESKYHGEWFVGFFQKKVMHSQGIAYFININQYNRPIEVIQDSPIQPELFEVNVQIESCDHKDIYLDFKFNPFDLNLLHIEQLVRVFFDTFGRDYE
ncbi:MAG: hypothetical protein HC836_10595 [Richelia sp. RM2_1_2]|nr:hypothetical protein [Richelia sp. RM2_1_2]